MSISAKQARKLRTLITKLMTAENAYAFKGSYPPETMKEIEEDYRVAKKRVKEYIDSLIVWDGRVRP